MVTTRNNLSEYGIGMVVVNVKNHTPYIFHDGIHGHLVFATEPLQLVHHSRFDVKSQCLCLAWGFWHRLIGIRNNSFFCIIRQQLPPICKGALLVKAEHVTNSLFISSSDTRNDRFCVSGHCLLKSRQEILEINWLAPTINDNMVSDE